MCGINGWIGGGVDLDARTAAVERMLAATQHRGPDGSGTGSWPAVTFGHNLLAVRGAAEASRQPYEVGVGLLTFNGEIYDFGQVPVSGVDTHALADRLLRYGPKVLDVADGMWALGWHDDATGYTLLARDRLGAKPLYFFEGRNFVVFSSELRGLFAAGVHKRLDPIGVLLYLRFGYVPGPRTLIAGVRKLIPGECREYGRDGTLRRNWNTIAPVKPTEFDPVVYRAKLVESVSLSLPTVRTAGLYLSGGMDSASVLWAMAECGMKPQTLSMRFTGAGHKQVLLDTDPDVAANLATHYGADHHEMVFTETDYLDNLAAFMGDEPISRKGMPAYLAAHARAARLGWVVAFTGDGGDELLSGYGRHIRISDPGYSKHRRACPIEQWLHLNSHTGGGDAWRDASVTEFDVAGYVSSWVPDGLLSGNPMQDELVLEGITHLAEDFLIRSDKLGMRYGLECRFPLLAEPFRSYALGLPTDVKIRGWETKWCAREAMRDVLPAAVIAKPKSGWGPPTGAWLSGKSDLVGPLGDRIKATLVPGRVPAIDAVLNVDKCRGRIKVALALFHLMLWAEAIGLEG